jgi:hypothetical protein
MSLGVCLDLPVICKKQVIYELFSKIIQHKDCKDAMYEMSDYDVLSTYKYMAYLTDQIMHSNSNGRHPRPYWGLRFYLDCRLPTPLEFKLDQLQGTLVEHMYALITDDKQCITFGEFAQTERFAVPTYYVTKPEPSSVKRFLDQQQADKQKKHQQQAIRGFKPCEIIKAHTYEEIFGSKHDKQQTKTLPQVFNPGHLNKDKRKTLSTLSTRTEKVSHTTQSHSYNTPKTRKPAKYNLWENYNAPTPKTPSRKTYCHPFDDVAVNGGRKLGIIEPTYKHKVDHKKSTDNESTHINSESPLSEDTSKTDSDNSSSESDESGGRKAKPYLADLQYARRRRKQKKSKLKLNPINQTDYTQNNQWTCKHLFALLNQNGRVFSECICCGISNATQKKHNLPQPNTHVGYGDIVYNFTQMEDETLIPEQIAIEQTENLGEYCHLLHPTNEREEKRNTPTTVDDETAKVCELCGADVSNPGQCDIPLVQDAEMCILCLDLCLPFGVNHKHLFQPTY